MSLANNPSPYFMNMKITTMMRVFENGTTKFRTTLRTP